MNTESGYGQYGAAALILAGALGACGAPQAQAQTEPVAQPRTQPRPHAAAPSTGFYAFGGFAALAAEKNSQLQGERGSPANLIAGGGYRLTPDLAVELNVLAAGRKLDTPPTAEPPAGTFAAGTLKSTMATGGIGATVKYSFAVQRFAPYFGGGVGAYTTTFQTRSEALGCAQNCSDTGPRVEERSRDIGVHALVGADYYITARHVVAGEIRYLRLKADFGAIGLGKVDAGGAFLWAGFRRHF